MRLQDSQAQAWASTPPGEGKGEPQLGQCSKCWEGPGGGGEPALRGSCLPRPLPHPLLPGDSLEVVSGALPPLGLRFRLSWGATLGAEELQGPTCDMSRTLSGP